MTYIAQPLVYFDTTTGYDFEATTNASVYDISSQVGNISIRRRRDLISDQFQAGTCRIRIYDTNGDWNPQNTSSPYYGKQLPMKKIQVWGQYSTPTGTNKAVMFKGYIESYNYTYPTNQDIGYLEISAVDAFRILNTAGITTVTGATAGETADSRFVKILNMISWPSNLWVTIASQGGTFTTVQADPGTSRTALNAINEVAFADQGEVYCSPAGIVGFYSRGYLQERFDDPVNATFTNGTIANPITEFPYVQVKFSTIDNAIYNQAQVTATGGTMQTYNDAASTGKYGLRNYYHQNSLNVSNSDAYSVAFNYADSRKDPVFRVENVSVKMSQVKDQNVSTVSWLLGINLNSKIRVYNQQINGQIVDVSQFVVSVSHDITPSDWTVSFGTYDLPVGGFILDSATEGILDTSRLGW